MSEEWLRQFSQLVVPTGLRAKNITKTYNMNTLIVQKRVKTMKKHWKYASTVVITVIAMTANWSASCKLCNTSMYTDAWFLLPDAVIWPAIAVRMRCGHCLASHLINNCHDSFPLLSRNDGVLIPGNSGMKKAGNPGCPGNWSPGIETLVLTSACYFVMLCSKEACEKSFYVFHSSYILMPTTIHVLFISGQ